MIRKSTSSLSLLLTNYHHFSLSQYFVDIRGRYAKLLPISSKKAANNILITPIDLSVHTNQQPFSIEPCNKAWSNFYNQTRRHS